MLMRLCQSQQLAGFSTSSLIGISESIDIFVDTRDFKFNSTLQVSLQLIFEFQTRMFKSSVPRFPQAKSSTASSEIKPQDRKLRTPCEKAPLHQQKLAASKGCCIKGQHCIAIPNQVQATGAKQLETGRREQRE